MRTRLLPLLALLPLVLIDCRLGSAEKADPLLAESEQILVDYLRIDTSNPPGNETAGASFLQKILQREQIESRLLGKETKRQSLYARLRSGSSEPPLLLLSHIDVVPADREEWTVPPFSGERANGYLWGRGALDIKSLTVAQMMAMVDLKRRATPLKRDVILLAVADEERGGLQGCKEVLEAYPDLFAGVGVVLNEGGSNKTVVDHLTQWGIEVQQKVPLWVRIRTRGAGGHAAIPPSDGGAVGRLVAILADLQKLELPRRVLPLVAQQQKLEGGSSSGGDEADRVITGDLLTATVLRAGTIVNAVPTRAEAEIDCRLLPDREPDDLLQQIRAVVGSRGEIEVLVAGPRAEASSIDTELYRLLQKTLPQIEHGSRVIPILSPGTSDSRYFRARGVAAYGFSPFKLNYYDYGTIHGADEKIRISFFHDGVQVMRDVVRAYAARS